MTLLSPLIHFISIIGIKAVHHVFRSLVHTTERRCGDVGIAMFARERRSFDHVARGGTKKRGEQVHTRVNAPSAKP